MADRSAVEQWHYALGTIPNLPPAIRPTTLRDWDLMRLAFFLGVGSVACEIGEEIGPDRYPMLESDDENQRVLAKVQLSEHAVNRLQGFFLEHAGFIALVDECGIEETREMDR